MVTASLLGDVVLAVVIGGGLLGLALLRPGAVRRRQGRRGQFAARPLASDLPIGRVVIASGLARSRRR